MRSGSLWRREALAIALQGRLMARGWRRRVQVPADAPRVAVFIHGFMATGPVFDPMRQSITGRTGLATLDFTYSSFTPFPRVAEQFRRFVAEDIGRDRCVSLVGHSLGGLLARWYIQEQGGVEHVDRLITLATPHAGTENMKLAPGVLPRALRPGSEVLHQLARSAHRLRAIPHTAIVAGQDRLVLPPSSAASVEGAAVAWLDDLGHNEMLFDERVHAIVAQALE